MMRFVQIVRIFKDRFERIWQGLVRFFIAANNQNLLARFIAIHVVISSFSGTELTFCKDYPDTVGVC
jgi:hypothetical protein